MLRAAISYEGSVVRSAILDAYIKTDDAIRNKADQMFSNPRTTSASINIPVNDAQAKIDIEKIQSDSAFNNSKIMLSILKNRIKNEAYYVVAANAALALHVAGYSDDLIACKDAAEESTLSGKAFEKLNALKNFGEKFQ